MVCTVLTAAHCCITFDSAILVENIVITVGANELDDDTVTAGTGGRWGSYGKRGNVSTLVSRYVALRERSGLVAGVLKAQH